VAESLPRGVIVTVFPDSADRYLSEPFWRQEDAKSAKFAKREDTKTNTLTLGPDAAAAIRSDGAKGYPHEVCGAMFGRAAGKVDEILPLTNISTEERRRRYLIGPDEYRVAERHADA